LEQKLSDTFYNIFGITSGGSNRIHMQLNSGGGTNSTLGFFYRVNGAVLYSSILQSIDVGTTYKFAVTYTQNSLSAYLNGVQIINETGYLASGGVFDSFGFDYGNYDFIQPTKKTLLFPTALSDAALIELTTI
jgi:hypothetical protein